MTMEDEMIKDLAHDAHVYVEGRDRPLSVGMYTDEHSEVCSIRFSNSFTLNVVTPLDLLMLAREIETFAKRAHELHYGEEPTGFRRPVGEAMAEIQKKLESCGVVEPVGVEWAINEARTMAEETKPQKEIMMKGTSSSCVWKDPSDPINW
jgi:hypothetical protein